MRRGQKERGVMVKMYEEGEERLCKICGGLLPDDEEEECHYDCELMLSKNDPDGTGQDDEAEE